MKIKEFKDHFDILKIDSNNTVNLFSEWHDLLKQIEIPNKLTKKSHVIKKELFYPECILNLYLITLIEYDKVSNFLLTNKDLQEIYSHYGCNDSKQIFLDYLTLFKQSYMSFCHQQKPRHKIMYSSFQNTFYYFLQEFEFLSGNTNHLTYRIPLHFSPIFISIVMAWDVCPIAYPDYSINNKNNIFMFDRFRHNCLMELENFELGTVYHKFADYILNLFFSDNYINLYTEKIPFCFGNAADNLYYQQLIKNYYHFLWEIHNNALYLYLKKEFTQKATKVFHENIKQLIEPAGKYEPIPHVTNFINKFFENLSNKTLQTGDRIQEYVNKNIKEFAFYDRSEEKIIYYIQPNFMEEYYHELHFKNVEYLKHIKFLCSELVTYVADCQIKTNISERRSFYVKTERLLTEFQERTAKLLENELNIHIKRLKEGYDFKEKNKHMPDNIYITDSQYPGLHTADSRYVTIYQKIMLSINKLKGNLKQSPPLSILTKSTDAIHKTLYPNPNEICDERLFCNQLFIMFYEKLCGITADKKKIFDLLQSYMNNHTDYIFQELIP